MSKLSVGSEAKVVEKATNKAIDVVITKVMEIDGFYCYYIRRKDNKQFKNKDGYSFNRWIKGDKIEES